MFENKIRTFFQTADCFKLDINHYSQLSLRPDTTGNSTYCPSQKGACCLPQEWIVFFYMMLLKFKLQNYLSYWDFTFMVYKSSWKIIFIQIFTSKGFLVLSMLKCLSIYITAQKAVMKVKKVAYTNFAI